MIGRIEAWLRLWRRRFSRSHWLARMLGFHPGGDGDTGAGLVLIQIDGLSHEEISRALDAGEMPFLKRLLGREHYRLHHHYSGVPSTTPAVQAELFYGVRGAVPGFSFREKVSGRLVRMYEPRAAAQVERELQAGGNPELLAGGSCYSGNYCGGAAEPHFCPAALGWGPSLREANPLALAVLFFSHLVTLVRAGLLMAVELVLAVIDCLRGLIQGQDIVRELLFVPTRAVIIILLRDLVTMGARIDIARGLPVIHLNFLGYDEQSHRRGPSARFAHWTLKGIDRCIASIWRAGHAASHRHYDVWIYADHGQQTTRSYASIHGDSLDQRLQQIVAAWQPQPLPLRSTGQQGMQLHRVRQFGGRRLQRLLAVNHDGNNPVEAVEPEPGLEVAALGPVAHIYCRNLPHPDRAELARLSVARAGVPLALYLDDSGAVCGYCREGEVSLPADGPRLLGPDHPFLDEAINDLTALCHHRDAGDVIVFGWRAGEQAISFAEENGAHGGFGPRETDAFLLLPDDIPAPAGGRDYWRPRDIHLAARRFLQRQPEEAGQTPAGRAVQSRPLRLMTYNVHSCIGMDGRLSPERIARVIARCAPDIVALQELDVGRGRTRGIDQAAVIAGLLAMDFHFHPAIHVESEQYGDAILSYLPMQLIKTGTLPGLANRPGLEPRGAVWVAIEFNGRSLQVINTHLGLLASERKLQAAALAGDQWLQHPDCRGPVIVCGDFNAGPGSASYRLLNRRLVDAQVAFASHKPRGTFFGRLPRARIDHVFISPEVGVTDIEIPHSELVKLASDHLPLVTELQF